MKPLSGMNVARALAAVGGEDEKHLMMVVMLRCLNIQMRNMVGHMYCGVHSLSAALLHSFCIISAHVYCLTGII